MKDFIELLEKRRSIRNYSDKKVDTAILNDIVEDVVLAPSSGNEQDWKFIIVNNSSMMERISKDAKAGMLVRIKNDPNDYAKKYEKMLSNESFNMFYNAPALIIILGNKYMRNSVVNCTLAASYLMFSAVIHGLGTCWINFAKAVNSQEILDELGIVEEDVMVAPIIIGYPEVIPQIPKRKELNVYTIE